MGVARLLLDRHGVSYNVTEQFHSPRSLTMKPVILEIFTDYI